MQLPIALGYSINIGTILGVRASNYVTVLTRYIWDVIRFLSAHSTMTLL